MTNWYYGAYQAYVVEYVEIVTFMVWQYRDLAVKDVLGSADPYVVVEVLNHSATTKVWTHHFNNTAS